MPELPRATLTHPSRLALPRRLRAAGAVMLLMAGALLPMGCGYQLALQPTPTPAGPLGVRQIPGQAQTIDPGAVIAQLAGGVTGSAATQPATAAAAGGLAPAAAAAAPAMSSAGAAAAPANPAPAPSFPRTSTAGSSSPPQAALPPAVNAAPAAAGTTQAALPPLAGTPLPSYTTTATPRATAGARQGLTNTPTATPAPAATRRAATQVYLPQGTSDFLYVGPTLPVDKALAALAGQYDMVWFTPAGASGQAAYKPGAPAAPILSTNTLVRIGMKQGMSFVMYPAN